MSAPASYEELHREYRSYVEYRVSQMGIDPQNVEDVASKLFVVFLEKDILGMFDPQYRYGIDSVEKHPKFTALLNSFISKYTLGFRTKQNTEKYREPLLVDTAVAVAGIEVPWIDLFGPAVWDVYSDTFIRDAYFYLACQDSTLSELFRCLYVQVADGAKRNVKALGRMLRMPERTVSRKLDNLKVLVNRLMPTYA